MSQTFLTAMVPLRNQLALLVQGKDFVDGPMHKFSNKVGFKFGPDNAEPALIDEQSLRAKDMMFGVGLVRDMKGNRHFLASSNNARRFHVEDYLKDFITSHFDESNIGLASAKVAFYIPASPCRKCTNQMAGWIKQMIKSITKDSKSRSVFFVFNFVEYYTKTKHGSGDAVWSDADEAQEAYAALSNDFGMTGQIVGGSGHPFTIPIVNFRQGSRLAQGGVSFEKLAGKTLAN